MRELTQDIPKPMIPVRGKPILLHIVEGLRDAGVEEFLIIVGYRRRGGHFVLWRRRGVRSSNLLRNPGGSGRHRQGRGTCAFFLRRGALHPQLRGYPCRSGELPEARPARKRRARHSQRQEERGRLQGRRRLRECAGSNSSISVKSRSRASRPALGTTPASTRSARSFSISSPPSKSRPARRIRTHRRHPQPRAERAVGAGARAAGRMGRRARPGSAGATERRIG